MFRAPSRKGARPSPALPGFYALSLAVLVVASLATAVQAAEPSPVLIDPLDPRAEGEGPGVVGSPLLVALAVVALGLAAAGIAAVYVRLSERR